MKPDLYIVLELRAPEKQFRLPLVDAFAHLLVSFSLGRPIRDYARYCQSYHSGSSSLQQSARAGIQCCASRKDIIYQQNPELVNLRSRAGGERATDRLPAFMPGQAMLRRPGLRAHQQKGSQRNPQAFRERPGDQFRLVVAPLPLPQRMKRNGNYYVRRQSFRIFRHSLREPGREPISQPGHLLIFQQSDAFIIGSL